MRQPHFRGAFGIGVLLLALASCSTPSRVEKEPASKRAVLPPPPSAGINTGLSDLEATWHLRSALNVAALACEADVPGMVSGYNSFLQRHQQLLSDAYASEKSGAASEAAFNQHVTRVYNHFAWPPYHAHFCREAGAVTTEGNGMSDIALRQWAAGALARIDPPGGVPADSGQSRGYTGSAAGREAPPPLRAKVRTVQLGAYTGRTRAEAAWQAIRGKLAGVEGMKPSYEAVPGRAPLVRLRVKEKMTESDAVALCASAAASGFACFPVKG